MAAIILILEEEQRRINRRVRTFIPRVSHLQFFEDVDLLKKSRLPKSSILKIVEMCRPTLERQTHRNHALPVDIIVLTALRFFAKGVFQEDCGELAGISQSAASCAVHAVTNILCDHVQDFVKFPATQDEMAAIKTGFYEMPTATTPNDFLTLLEQLTGHIKIKSPTGLLEPLFVCQKGGHSINVQFICDSSMRLLDVVARWPGSPHDAFIWKNSEIRAAFVEAPPSGWLIGDTGYGIEPWLLTPICEPTTDGERRYNKALVCTRKIAETAIGLFKSVFRRFDLTGGPLLYSPENVCKMVAARAVLHNIRRDLRLPEDNASLGIHVEIRSLETSLHDRSSI